MEQAALIKNGKLENNPLTELLREAIAEDLTGAFRITQERVKGVIYCYEGAVVYVVSNIRSQNLSGCLRRWGILTDEQVASLGAKNSDFEFAQEILKRGFLTKEDLLKSFERQSLEILGPFLSWTAGEWEFDGRVRIVEGMRFSLHVKELLVESARQTPPDVMAARFTNPNEKISPSPVDLSNIQLQPIEGFILSRLDMPLQLNELLSISGMPENATLHALYALSLCGYVSREWNSIFSKDELEVLRKTKMFFKPSAISAPKTEEKKPAPKEQPAPKEKPVPKQESKPTVDPRKELERFLSRVENAQTFYDVLGLGTLADEAELKRAYHQAAKSYHPDKFHNEAGTTFHSRVQKAFARLAQSYDTLNDKTLRAAYDKKLASGFIGNKNVSATTIAEQKFQLAMDAMRQNNLGQALPLFGQAVRLAPTQARYHAEYAQALIKNPQLRKQAEAEFQEAIKYDEKNLSYKIMLARFYRDMRLFKRAEGEIQRILDIDPNNKDAQRLLDSLKNI